MVGILKSISASQVFREYPELKKHLRKQAFWEEGYFVRTVGDAVTAAVVQRYIRSHRHEEHEASLNEAVLRVLESPALWAGNFT